MSGRIANLQAALIGYKKTGIALVQYTKTGLLAPLASGSADDMGLYYWSTFVADILHVSAEQAATLFLGALLVVGAISSVIAFSLLAKQWRQRFISYTAIALAAAISWYVGDVYIAYFFMLSFIPWIIFIHTRHLMHVAYFLYFFIGLCAAFSHYIRSHAALAVVLFLAATLFFEKKIKRKQKSLLISLFVLGALLPIVHFKSVRSARDVYLFSQGVKCQTETEKHVFWHTVYIGLGYISNDKVISYNDGGQPHYFKQKYPGAKYPTAAYEQACKKEWLYEMIYHPHYFMSVYTAKAGVLLYYFLFFAGWGLFYFFFRRKKWQLIKQIPWGLALAAGALPGLIAIPITMYLTGFITICLWYALYLIIV